MDFTYRGQSASSFGLRVKSKSRPILPDIRQEYVEVAKRDGSYDFSGGELEDRLIEIDCAFIETNVGDLRYKARQLAKWLYGTKNDKGRLIFTDEPDLFYNAKLNNKIDIEQTITMGEFTLAFRCDPHAYSTEYAKDAYDLNSPTLLYRELTANDKYLFENLSNGDIFTVNNYGSATVAPTLLINNPSRNNLEISLMNTAGTEKVAELFIKDFPNGVTLLTLDMNKFMCYRPNGENKLDMVYGNWWELESGFNKIYVTGFGGEGSIEFIFNAKFL